MEITEVKLNKWLVILSFIMYLFILVWGLLLKCCSYLPLLGAEYSLDPIQAGNYILYFMECSLLEKFTYGLTAISTTPRVIIEDIFMNIIVFMPLGFVIPFVCKKQVVVKTIFSGFFISLIMEITQLLVGVGSFAVMDLVTNTLGTTLGLFILLLLVKFLNPKTLNIVIKVLFYLFFVLEIGVIIFAIYRIVTRIDVLNYRFSNSIKVLIREIG